MNKVTEETKIKIIQLEKLIADLREKEREQTIIKSQSDSEIHSLKTSVTTCKEEQNRLSES